MNTLALYQLAADYRAAAEAMADLDFPESAIADTLEGMRGEIEEKAVAVAMFTKNLEANADSIEEAAKAMMARAKSIRKREEWLRDYLRNNMQATGITKIECPYFKITLRQNPEHVVVADEASIPRDYWKPQPDKLDKALVSQALKDGYDVPGAHLERGMRVEIK